MRHKAVKNTPVALFDEDQDMVLDVLCKDGFGALLKGNHGKTTVDCGGWAQLFNAVHPQAEATTTSNVISLTDNSSANHEANSMNTDDGSKASMASAGFTSTPNVTWSASNHDVATSNFIRLNTNLQNFEQMLIDSIHLEDCGSDMSLHDSQINQDHSENPIRELLDTYIILTDDGNGHDNVHHSGDAQHPAGTQTPELKGAADGESLSRYIAWLDSMINVLHGVSGNDPVHSNEYSSEPPMGSLNCDMLISEPRLDKLKGGYATGMYVFKCKSDYAIINDVKDVSYLSNSSSSVNLKNVEFFSRADMSMGDLDNSIYNACIFLEHQLAPYYVVRHLSRNMAPLLYKSKTISRGGLHDGYPILDVRNHSLKSISHSPTTVSFCLVKLMQTALIPDATKRVKSCMFRTAIKHWAAHHKVLQFEDDRTRDDIIGDTLNDDSSNLMAVFHSARQIGKTHN